MKNRLALMLCLVVSAFRCTRVVDAVTKVEGCVPGSTDPDCAPTGWPTTGHGANSDPWLVTHNQVITTMKPNVLVLNFDNGVSSSQTQATAQNRADAIKVGSTYHGYQDSSAPQFLQYQIAKVVDLTDGPGTINPSSRLPLTPTGGFDPSALFSAQFAAYYGYTDPTSPSGFLLLCQLFEQGLINEVWIQDGEDAPLRAPLYAEHRLQYGDNGQATILHSFDNCVGGGSGVDCLEGIPSCGVTVRIGHLDPASGTGPADPSCDIQVWGWGIEGMWADLPDTQADAFAFLNRDFDTRFGVSFKGWSDICKQAGDATPCVSYPTSTRATSTPADTTTGPWTFDPFSQGCGSSQFPPNATYRDDFTDAVPVDARCEHFGLHDATGGGGDMTEAYTGDTVATLNQTYPAQKCGGGWQIYWRQSMPGYGNQATASDGSPMKNWWPMLFY